MATSTKAIVKKCPVRAGVFPPAKIVSVDAVRGRLRLSQKMFSRLAGFSERAIADWESGKTVSEPGRPTIIGVGSLETLGSLRHCGGLAVVAFVGKDAEFEPPRVFGLCASGIKVRSWSR
jgi:hypothetical protein